MNSESTEKLTNFVIFTTADGKVISARNHPQQAYGVFNYEQ